MTTRRTLLLGTMAGALLMAAPATGDPQRIRNFYVAATGNDSNDGLTPATAWLTTAKVNAVTFLPGDCINFRCGDTFYGPLSPAALSSVSVTPNTVAAYGGYINNLPTLSMYKIVNAGAWTNVGGGVWSANVNDLGSITGNIYSLGAAGANIGHINIDGVIYSAKQSSQGALSNDWDFYSDQANTLYVKSVSNPGSRATVFRCAPQDTSFTSGPNWTLRNLIFEGCGGNALAWTAASNIDCQWCWVRSTGGAYITGTTRYGNGAQFFPTSANCIVSNCLFGDIYDVAATCQGYPVINAGDGFFNVAMNDNISYRCSQSFEAWDQYGATPGSGTPAAGSGFSSVKSLRWRAFDMQQGPLVGPGHIGSVSAGVLLGYHFEAPLTDIHVSLTSMSNCAGLFLAFPFYQTDTFPAAYVVDASALTMQSAQLIMSGYSQTATQFAAWQTSSGLAGTSTMTLNNSPSATPDAVIQGLWYASRPPIRNLRLN